MSEKQIEIPAEVQEMIEKQGLPAYEWNNTIVIARHWVESIVRRAIEIERRRAFDEAILLRDSKG